MFENRTKISELVWGKISRARAVVGGLELKTTVRIQEQRELWQEKTPTGRGTVAGGAQSQGYGVACS